MIAAKQAAAKNRGAFHPFWKAPLYKLTISMKETKLLIGGGKSNTLVNRQLIDVDDAHVGIALEIPAYEPAAIKYIDLWRGIYSVAAGKEHLGITDHSTSLSGIESDRDIVGLIFDNRLSGCYCTAGKEHNCNG